MGPRSDARRVELRSVAAKRLHHNEVELRWFLVSTSRPSRPIASPLGTMTSYSYRPRILTMLWAGGFFALACAFFIHRASTNDRGLVIRGMIEFGVEGATRFFAALTVVSALFVIIAVGLTVLGLIRGPRLVLEDDHMIIPSGLWVARTRVVRFADIRRLSETKVSGQDLLTLTTTSGAVTLIKGHFACNADYAEVLAILRQKTAAVSA